jgi:hypothetical protein
MAGDTGPPMVAHPLLCRTGAGWGPAGVSEPLRLRRPTITRREWWAEASMAVMGCLPLLHPFR